MGVRQVRMGGSPVEVVDSFCYLGDVIQCEGGAEVAVRGRIACAWKSWRELASLLVKQNIPLGSRAQVYRACVRSVFLYRAETWAKTKQLDVLLIRCDGRLLRYVMAIRWQDGLSNEEVVRSGLEGLEVLLRRNRLRCFGHVEKGGGRYEDAEHHGRNGYGETTVEEAHIPPNSVTGSKWTLNDDDDDDDFNTS